MYNRSKSQYTGSSKNDLNSENLNEIFIGMSFKSSHECTNLQHSSMFKLIPSEIELQVKADKISHLKAVNRYTNKEHTYKRNI